MTPAAIVLAGGRASRFGGDKLAARIDGIPVLEHALRAVAQVADPVVVVVSPDAPLSALPALPGIQVVPARDLIAHQGPLAGLAGGLAALAVWAASGLEGAEPGIVLLVAGDMPTLDPRVLALLVRTLDADPSLGAVSLESEAPSPLPCAIRVALARPAALALLAQDRRSLRGLLESVPSSTVPSASWRAIDPDGRTLRDIDTREDLSGR